MRAGFCPCEPWMWVACRYVLEDSTVKALFLLPSRNLTASVPTVLVLGFAVGLLVDTSRLRDHMLLAAMLMIYPSMIGFTMGDVLRLAHFRLLCAAMAINFVGLPLLGYLLGTWLLLREPELFAGLALLSLLPSSSMSIAFTTLARGNVAASVTLTVLGLLLGSLLAPWYLLVMVGRFIPVDVWAVLWTIVAVVFVPLLAGNVTYRLLLRRYSRPHFESRIKPLLLAATSWGMIYIVGGSISANAHQIVSQPDLILLAMAVLLLFYAAACCIGVQVGGRFHRREDAIALLFGTLPRYLSIAMGVAAAAFGPNAVLMLALAFVVQSQFAVWSFRLIEKRRLFREKPSEGVPAP